MARLPDTLVPVALNIAYWPSSAPPNRAATFCNGANVNGRNAAGLAGRALSLKEQCSKRQCSQAFALGIRTAPAPIGNNCSATMLLCNASVAHVFNAGVADEKAAASSHTETNTAS